MSIEIRDEDHSSLSAYSAIPIAYTVREAVDVTDWPTRPVLPRYSVTPPYVKDYDAIPGNHPNTWTDRFAIDRACFLAAHRDGQRVGGIVVIVDSADVARLGGNGALIWDLRIAPSARGQGIGRALLAAAEALVRANGGSRLTAETQNTNVAACNLYERAGYTLIEVDRDAYADFPAEIRLLWAKAFDRSQRPADHADQLHTPRD